MGKSRTVTRPDFMRLPSLALPIYVRSTGYSEIEPGWSGPGGDDSPFVQLFWGVEGHGELMFDGVKLPFGPGDVTFLRRGESHRYFAGGNVWKLRWFTFDGPGAMTFLESYAYPQLLKDAGQCPHGLFDEIATGLREMTPFRQRKLVAVAAEILAHAGGGSSSDSSPQGRMVHRFVELAQENHSNSSVNVNSLADIIGVHRTTLSRVFKERMMLSPGEYLARLRMQHALSLLEDSDMSIAEIAGAVGIDDPTYFCRCVKRATGLSPREFRNAMNSRA
jgi:AraC-like DNA-binding protein